MTPALNVTDDGVSGSTKGLDRIDVQDMNRRILQNCEQRRRRRLDCGSSGSRLATPRESKLCEDVMNADRQSGDCRG